ncbi:pimeloyl-ACP methyl esterase BioG family protein [Pseudophaeobacter sp.]|uniref:pimeloyl-ACP methyl esterase BioG family protein n=1 Tax=Pseudophaeobacter sp. TaxID=1971739 RepID=UPI003298863D
MQYRWIRKSQTPVLGPGPRREAIVVFGGWAVGPEVFTHLAGDQDVLFIQDYRSLEMDLPDLSGYAHVSLLAWSFGVAAYGHWQAGRADPFDRKVAVNGSLSPVDRDTGIPPVALRKTIKTLSTESYQLFLSRAFGSAQPAAVTDVEARKAELLAVEARGPAPDPGFDRVWISSRDKIFPPANLARAWAGQGMRQCEAPHMPFAAFASWQALLS